eukprot:scaffold433_cov257-Pinguiococcus_pyrenoidosus.AAC.28
MARRGGALNGICADLVRTAPRPSPIPDELLWPPASRQPAGWGGGPDPSGGAGPVSHVGNSPVPGVAGALSAAGDAQLGEQCSIRSPASTSAAHSPALPPGRHPQRANAGSAPGGSAPGLHRVDAPAGLKSTGALHDRQRPLLARERGCGWRARSGEVGNLESAESGVRGLSTLREGRPGSAAGSSSACHRQKSCAGIPWDLACPAPLLAAAWYLPVVCRARNAGHGLDQAAPELALCRVQHPIHAGVWRLRAGLHPLV